MDYVMVTGAGRPEALGFNLVWRCLERGDTVLASVRRPCPPLEALAQTCPGRLHILTMDVSDTASVRAAAEQAGKRVPRVDLLVNNAVTTSPDCNKEFMQTDLDRLTEVFNVDAVGPLRVIQAWMPLLRQSPAALVVNISSEAGSIGTCYRTNMLDYAVAKAALNMATKTLHNACRELPDLNILCLHPGWMRTNPGNAAAPLLPYDHARTLLDLFRKVQTDKSAPVFMDYKGEAYPW